MQTDPRGVSNTGGSPTGEIFDRGYRHYEGTREGRSSAIRALIIYSIKRGLGIKKRWTAKVVPFMLLVFAFFPVIVIVGIRSFLGPFAEQFNYLTLYNSLSLILLVFAAASAPEMLSDDRRQRVLPLYFSRSLSRADYLLAKLAALGVLLGTVAFLPALFLFLGTMFLADSPLSYLGDNATDLLRIVATGTILSLFYAAVGLVVAGFTERKSIAAAIYIGVFLILSGITGALFSALDGEWSRYILLFDPQTIPEGITYWIFEDEPNPDSFIGRAGLAGYWYLGTVLAVTAFSATIMYWRYLRDE